MTPFPTQGSARACGGVCFAVVERSAKAGTVSRLAEPLKSALPGEGRALPGEAGQKGFVYD